MRPRPRRRCSPPRRCNRLPPTCRPTGGCGSFFSTRPSSSSEDWMMDRRHFLGLAGALPLAFAGGSRALAALPPLGKRTLVLVELNGGNDGLNTVIPCADPRYLELRPRIGIPRDQVLKLDEHL